jgi:Thioredoxin
VRKKGYSEIGHLRPYGFAGGGIMRGMVRVVVAMLCLLAWMTGCAGNPSSMSTGGDSATVQPSASAEVFKAGAKVFVPITSQAQLDEYTQKDSGPVLVWYRKKGCYTCSLLKRHIYPLAVEFEKTIKFVEVMPARTPELIKPNKVLGYPTLRLYVDGKRQSMDDEGRSVTELLGLHHRSALRVILKKAVAASH